MREHDQHYYKVHDALVALQIVDDAMREGRLRPRWNVSSEWFRLTHKMVRKSRIDLESLLSGIESTVKGEE